MKKVGAAIYKQNLLIGKTDQERFINKFSQALRGR